MKLNSEQIIYQITKIKAICIDKDISEEDSGLFSYIHLKILESSNPFYFLNPPDLERDTILIMLGDESTIERVNNDIKLDSNSEESEYITNMAQVLKALDIKLREEYGLENRISSELKYRLKLYTDKNFCLEKTNFYFKEIISVFYEYTDEKIDEIVNQKINKKDDIDELLSEIGGL